MPMGALNPKVGSEIKITVEVKTLIKRLNTCFQMETR